MNITPKLIKERCGTISFKKGEAFCHANKVTFATKGPLRFEATVRGAEHFNVVVVDEGDTFRASCSCPVLASYTKDCQHIAAVLLAIYQDNETNSAAASLEPVGLALDVLQLFQTQPRRMSHEQFHFEKREILPIHFGLKLYPVGDGQTRLGLTLRVGEFPISSVQKFIKTVMKSEPFSISPTFKFDPLVHCFIKEVDAVFRLLMMLETGPTTTELLTIPPAVWDAFEKLILKVPHVEVKEDQTYPFVLREELPPLRFDLTEAEGDSCLLSVRGLEKVSILPAYNLVVTQGTFIKVRPVDGERLYDLQQLLRTSHTKQIHFSGVQFAHFFEQVLPHLRKLGQVQVAYPLAKRMLKTPLVAKLYLDRLKNRLLAGLEFHYENQMVDPLTDRFPVAGRRFIRDEEKEKEILSLLTDSGFSQTEGGFFLHNEELEYEFLTYTLTKLQKLTQVYATTAIRNRIVQKGTVQPAIRVKVKKDRTNWLEFKFEMDGIPEQEIKDVLRALEEKRKYYRLKSGALLSLEAREFEEIQRFLKALPVQEVDWESHFEMNLTTGLSWMNTLEDHSLLKPEESLTQLLQNLREPSRMDVGIPEALAPILRDYQKQGYHWMKTLKYYGFGGVLADDMGLGKTLQSIAYIVSELSVIRSTNKPVLVVCPSSLTFNWLRECMKFAPDIQAVVVDGTSQQRTDILNQALEQDVIITSYPLLRRDYKWYEKQNFHTIFFDEAQAFKNPITQTARTVKKLQAHYRFALTGTPIENSSEELWAIFHVVFPELFKGLKEFSQLTEKMISRRVRPFLLRRLKEDVVSELPGKVEFVETVELLPEQKKPYAAYLAKLREETLKHLDKETIRKNRIRILAGLTRLRQICCHPGLFVDGFKGRSGKFERLLRIIEEAQASGRRVLIFSQFTKMLELIGRELAYNGVEYFYLDGQTPADQRLNLCERFNDGEGDLFLISLKAGGTGLNLTGADTVILYDLWWNPAVEAQAADRAYRIGQTKQVQVIKLVTKGTVEEKMTELQDRKRNLIEEIIEAEATNSGVLTEEDLKEILS